MVEYKITLTDYESKCFSNSIEISAVGYTIGAASGSDHDNWVTFVSTLCKIRKAIGEQFDEYLNNEKIKNRRKSLYEK